MKTYYKCGLFLVVALGLTTLAMTWVDAQEDSKKTPVTKPADSKLNNEGDELTDTVGRIENFLLDPKKKISRLVFRPIDGKGFFILLENSLLEKLEKHTSAGELPVKISGVVTVYNGKNYLLLRRAAVKRSE